MIIAENLTRYYGHIKALNAAEFRIGKGGVTGFLGPNGAGKSTTMNLITGCIAPNSGRVLIDGIDMAEYPEEARKRIGYLPENPPLYPDLTVDENLDFAADFRKTRKSARRSEREKLCDLVNIGDVRHRLVGNLSRGYRQRVGLARALVGNPPLLILDEPTAGLDPKQIIETREIIRDLGRDHTVVLSSHILPEVSAVCRRIIIIDHGNIIASDTPENLSARLSGASRLQLLARTEADTLKRTLLRVPGVKSVKSSKGPEAGTAEAVVEAEEGVDIRETVFRMLADSNLPVLQMRPMDLSLEDIFLNLTTGEDNT